MSVVAPTILNFGRIVLNLISYFFTVCKAISTGADICFLLILLHLEFTLNFSTILYIPLISGPSEKVIRLMSGAVKFMKLPIVHDSLPD